MGDIIISFGDSEGGPGSVRPLKGWLCKWGQRGLGLECRATLPCQHNHSHARGTRPLSCNTAVFKTQGTPKRKIAFHQAPWLGFPLQTRQEHQSFSLEAKGKMRCDWLKRGERLDPYHPMGGVTAETKTVLTWPRDLVICYFSSPNAPFRYQSSLNLEVASCMAFPECWAPFQFWLKGMPKFVFQITVKDCTIIKWRMFIQGEIYSLLVTVPIGRY